MSQAMSRCTASEARAGGRGDKEVRWAGVLDGGGREQGRRARARRAFRVTVTWTRSSNTELSKFLPALILFVGLSPLTGQHSPAGHAQ